MQRVNRIIHKETQGAINHVLTNLAVDLVQPGFFFDPNTGIYDYITVGNDKWMRGDIISVDKMKEYLQQVLGVGGGGEDEEDEFSWTDIEQKYLNVLFNELELPNLTKKSIESEHKEIVRCGYSTNGSNIDLMKTFMNAVGRRMALKSPLEEELKKAKEAGKDEEELELLEDKINAVSFIDDIDLRYRRYDEVVIPSKKMVMFLLLDVSGSMGQEEKNLAKLFSKLVITFLSKQYDQCQIEYIIFNDSAHSVDHKEFFYGKKTGGNQLYTALDLEYKIIQDKYKQDWNIYTTIFSDTGMYGDDMELSINGIAKLLSYQQYMIYVNIYEDYLADLNHLVSYFKAKSSFNYCTINDEEEILIEFIKMFSKKGDIK